MYTPTIEPSSADVVDLADVGRSLRRGWRGIVGTAIVGILAAGAVLLWAPRRFQGAASVVLKSASDPSTSLLGRLGIPTDIAPSTLTGSLKSPLETELAVLQSHAVLGAVSDSLGLQVRVLEPSGAAPWQLLRPAAYAGSFKKRTLRFDRDGSAYRVSGPNVRGELAPGRALPIDVGTLTLADGPLPQHFEVQLLDREDALARLSQRVGVDKTGGEVVTVAYAAPDSLSAAAVPNAIVDTYLGRRHTVDRGVNQTRAEFLAAQLDSVNRQLAESERALRAFQEGPNGVIDPEMVGKLELETDAKAQADLAANQVESQALDSLLQRIGNRGATSRELVGFPSFLRSPAMNDVLTQLVRLEGDRMRLLERRTETDPEVVAVDQNIRHLNEQFLPLGRAYAAALGEQRRELSRQLAAHEALIARLPQAAQRFVRLQRDVRRLSETSVALEAQLLSARLATIGEGGEARRLDSALTPKRVAFPRPIPTLLVGFGVGLFVGTIAVVLAGVLTTRVGNASQATRLLGLPAAQLGRGSAVFHAACNVPAGVSVVPVDGAADALAVAEWLVGGPALGRAGARRLPAPAYTLSGAPTAERSNGTPLAAYDAPAHDGPASEGVARVPRVLPVLASPDGAAAVARAGRVVLAASSDVSRDELADAVAAVRLAGAEPIAVVLT